MPDTAALPSSEDSLAWDVIAQVSDLLAPEAEAHGGNVQAAFELVEDALAERRQVLGQAEAVG